jgi:LL-diaminopimelate aminotransferase
MATQEYLEKVVRFARKHDLFIIYDNDNSETFHGAEKPLGIMQIEGAKDVAFDVHTMSKAFGMPGLRIGFVVSNKDFINTLHEAHAMTLSSVPTHIQLGAAAALLDDSYNEMVNRQYQERAKWVGNELEKLGAKFIRPEGTFYLWVPVPPGYTSVEFCKYVMQKTNVMLGHGNAFGSEGEGYVRIALAEPANALRDGVQEPIKEAFRRLQEAGIRFDRPKQMQAG